MSARHSTRLLHRPIDPRSGPNRFRIFRTKKENGLKYAVSGHVRTLCQLCSSGNAGRLAGQVERAGLFFMQTGGCLFPFIPQGGGGGGAESPYAVRYDSVVSVSLMRLGA